MAKAVIVFSLGVVGLVGSSFLALAQSPDGSGLQSSIAVDIVGKAGNQASGESSDRMDVREAEALFFAPIDHLFDGQLNMAAHQEGGEAMFEIHEAFVGSTKLIPRSRFRLGQFFLGFGRLNQFHRHDWPFISAPKAHREFFGEEGIFDTGAEYAVLLPTPFVLDFTLGVTNGWTFGHTHSEGKRPLFPTHYGRLLTYLNLPGDGGMQVGLNYLGRRDADGVKTSIFGFDVTAKWQEAQTLVFLIQSEAYWRYTTPRDAKTEKGFGGYLYPQYGFSPNWLVGVRSDFFTNLTLEDAGGNKINNIDYALVPTLTFKSSEFSTWKLAYQFEGRREDGRGHGTNNSVELQATFILGAHPAHDF